jgi:hypothetical protein
MLAYSTLGHVVERHVGNKALDSKGAENTLTEAIHTVTTGFPLYGEPLWLIICVVIGVVALFALYSVAGKGEGSHAGREEPRRAYRRELARQMARDDAKKILAGEDPMSTKKRKKWMQW